MMLFFYYQKPNRSINDSYSCQNKCSMREETQDIPTDDLDYLHSADTEFFKLLKQ